MDMPPGGMATTHGRGGGVWAGEWKRGVVFELSHDTCTYLGHWSQRNKLHIGLLNVTNKLIVILDVWDES